MQFNLSNVSRRGAVRLRNEDAILIDPEMGLFAVADGIGGLPNGELASKTAVNCLWSIYSKEPSASPDSVIFRVNEYCRTIGFAKHHFGFGTTLSYAKWDAASSSFSIGHIGDSKIVHLPKDDDPIILTTEHTVAERIRTETPEGQTPVISMQDHHSLTQCIGQDTPIDPQYLSQPIKPGDRLAVFSDGFIKPFNDTRIVNILSSGTTVQSAVRQACQEVEKAGSPDNYSIILAELKS